MSHPALHTPRSQQALALFGATLVTTVLLAGVLGLAGGEQAAALAQSWQPAALAQQGLSTAPQTAAAPRA